MLITCQDGIMKFVSSHSHKSTNKKKNEIDIKDKKKKNNGSRTGNRDHIQLVQSY